MCWIKLSWLEKDCAKVKMITKQVASFTVYTYLPKKYCLTIIGYGVIKEHKTFKDLKDSEGLLDRSQYFKMIEGEKSICIVT